VTEPASRLVCSGCGASPSPSEPFPFRCPNHGSIEVDHVLKKVLDATEVEFPSGRADSTEPFVTYRSLLHSYHRAISGGISDGDFLALVDSLDKAVASIDGHGFTATPFTRCDGLSRRLGFTDDGGIWIKDETGNVSGSHKGRHLMGVLLHLEVSERLGLSDPGSRPDLAIASCGNAALAAAVVAAAGGRRLRVFVPVDADPSIVRQLDALGSDVVVCPRRPGVAGDPAYIALCEELARGALPFTCQGNENGLAIEGGETLAYEVVADLSSSGIELDHLVVQVGGGALASSCMQGFDEAAELHAIGRIPRIHTVQTRSAHPLERAYHLLEGLLGDNAGPGDVERALHEAAGRRSSYMWPWESEPKSIAGGILDDETYDWLAVVGGMLRSGGRPLVVSEERLAEANELGVSAGFHVDATGTSGLAGMLDLLADRTVTPDQKVAVLFTGVQR